MDPHFYQTFWFLTLAAVSSISLIYAAHRFNLQQVNSRFALVLEERTRLAREIHDTLAQNFIAISSQLDMVADNFDGDEDLAQRHLRLARKMTHHSFTEARRAVMDLRGAEIESRDLPEALVSAAKRWVAGTPLSIQVEASCPDLDLPSDLARNILRIAQEAVTNSMKHAGAHTIWVTLASGEGGLRLRVKDDGNGFESRQVFDMAGGHFGILGMGERARRFGGKFKIDSRPGAGTEIEVTVPIEAGDFDVNQPRVIS